MRILYRWPHATGLRWFMIVLCCLGVAWLAYELAWFAMVTRPGSAERAALASDWTFSALGRGGCVGSFLDPAHAGRTLGEDRIPTVRADFAVRGWLQALLALRDSTALSDDACGRETARRVLRLLLSHAEYESDVEQYRWELDIAESAMRQLSGDTGQAEPEIQACTRRTEVERYKVRGLLWLFGPVRTGGRGWQTEECGSTTGPRFSPQGMCCRR